MLISTSNELFINMKRIPTPDSQEYEAFVLEEYKKCINGITINGVHISNWLYWHINHWKITGDAEDGSRPIITPKLRDNEWMIAEAVFRGETEKLGVCIVGLRQMGKSMFSASYSARKATLIKNSQNIIVGGSGPDLNNITGAIDFGMLNVTEFFRVPRITRDWSDNEVFLGVKTQAGDNKIHSSFRIRNIKEGKKTEAVAGATTSSILFDEIGKSDFAQALEAAKPSLLGEYGWRAIPILTGTGGSFDKGKDAEVMFFSPETNDIVSFIDEQTNRKTGLFMPGYLRTDCKYDTTLANYLGVESEDLSKIEMKVSDKEKAIEKIKHERTVLAKDPDSSKLLKRIMYYPLEVEEVFLSETGNIFPKELLIEQKNWLSRNPVHSDCVELYTDSSNIVKHRFTDKKPIMHYPSRPDDNRDGIIQIWEYPILNAPKGLYIAATDPYKQPMSAYSDSVGSTYIFKRIYDPTNDKFQNMIVACYNGRPKKLETWYENTKLLLKFYDCKTLCENEDRGFIQHCKDKNEAHIYLIPQAKQIIDGVHPNSTVVREYGIHATHELINYFNTSIVEYIQQVLKTETQEEELVETLGIRKIIDPLLLDEMIKYDGKMNADRIRSFGILLAYAKSLDRVPMQSRSSDNRIKEYNNFPKSAKNIFSGSKTPFKIK